MNQSPLTNTGSWLLDILLLPGNALVYLLVTYAPPVAEFLQLRVIETGTLTITATAVVWLAAIVIAGTLLTKIREIDRSATAWVAACYGEIKRRIRVLKRRITATLAQRSQSRRQKDDALVVDMVRLTGRETAILRCLSAVDDGAVLTADEIAAQLGLPPRELTRVLQRLVELDLVKRRADSGRKRDGHCIATAGQMYLLSA